MVFAARRIQEKCQEQQKDILFQLMAYLPAQIHLLTWSDNFTMEYCLSIKVEPSPLPSHRVTQGCVLFGLVFSVTLMDAVQDSSVSVDLCFRIHGWKTFQPQEASRQRAGYMM